MSALSLYVLTLTAAGRSLSSLYREKIASALVLISACFAKKALTSALRPSSYSHSDDEIAQVTKCGVKKAEV